MAAIRQTFRDKRVLVTGHTGFKGAWLSQWLLELGAHVTGLALDPPTQPNLFEQLDLARRLTHRVVDIRDAEAVRAVVNDCQPDFIFHLAAQSLVRLSYAEPVATYAVNVMGAAHLLDAVRLARRPCTVIAVTTDKCYENREWTHGYREEDPLGGHDPYSSSKAAMEILVAAYRKSFFADGGVRLASARAGNVIGGGDWALDRIVPDTVRALGEGRPADVRNPSSTRPWQHVLEPLGGYLTLAAALHDASGKRLDGLSGAFNFGPALSSNRTVRDLVEAVLRRWPGEWRETGEPAAVHEAGLLNLSSDKAFHLLDWRPAWDFEETVARTVDWHRQAAAGADPVGLTNADILAYVAAAEKA